MRPCKHVEITEKGNSPLGLYLARLDTGTSIVPLVAHCFATKIALSYWSNRGAGEWKSCKRDHARTDYPSENRATREQDPDVLANLPWSQSIGLTAGNGKAFLVYKRNLWSNQGLFVERFGWDEDSQCLTSESLAKVPLQSFHVDPNHPIDLCGFTVWAGFGSDKLAIAIQARAKTDAGDIKKLVVLTAESPEDASLRSAASWNATVVDEASWDFDARVHDDMMYLVYRVRESPFKITTDITPPEVPHGLGNITCPPVDVQIDTANLDTAPYERLRLRRVDLSDLTIEDLYDDIPGGEHPRLQCIDPLCLTVDRIRSATVTCVTKYLFDEHSIWWRRTLWRYITTAIHSRDTILVRRQSNLWAIGTLFGNMREPIVPRNRTNQSIFNEMTSLAPVPGTNLHDIGIMTVETYRPAWMTFQGRVEGLDAKSEAIDFLAHNSTCGTVMHYRFQINVTSDRLAPTMIGYSIVDINHAAIDAPISFDMNTAGENGQFSPWSTMRPSDVDHGKHYKFLGSQIGDERDRGNPIDNTIGGCLVMDFDGPPMSFYAYTDLGDGGCRVFFDETSDPQPPMPGSDIKEFGNAHIPAPRSDDVGEVVLEHTGFWEEIDLPSYPVEALAAPLCGFDHSLDLLILYLPSLVPETQNGDTVTAHASDIAALESFIMLFSGTSSRNVNPPATERPLNAGIVYTPSIIFPGYAVCFTGSAEVDGYSDSFTYHWEFSDGSEYDGEQVNHSFQLGQDDDGQRQVTLFVSDSAGRTEQVTATLHVQDGLWDSLWQVHTLMNASPEDSGQIKDVAIDVSKYKVSYFLDDDDNRDRVEILAKPNYHAFRKFVGLPTTQGDVELTLPLAISSDSVRLPSPYSLAFACDNLAIALAYGRMFTPGLLSSEIRTNNPVTREYGPEQMIPAEVPAALAAKPCEATTLNVAKVEVKFSITLVGMVFGICCDVLITLGLMWVANLIASAISAAAEAALGGWIGLIIAAAILTALSLFVAFGVPRIVASVVEDKIKERLEAPAFKDNLDSQGLLRYAGEGLSESIAVDALRKIDDAEPEATGLNRMLKNTWEMIYVTNNRCRIFYRKTEPGPEV
jgi:hypothetical protein